MARRHQVIEKDEYYKLVNKQMSRDDLLTEYRKLAKRLNQRIVTLEKAGYGIPKGEGLRFLESEGRRRFQERIKNTTKSDEELKRDILIMHRFEKSDRTTLRGIKETKRKTRESLTLRTMTDKEQEDYKKLSKKEKANYMKQHGVSQDLSDFTLKHINDLKDMMVWEYEKALDYILGEIKINKNITEDDIKKIIETAVNTRNEKHFDKMIALNSRTGYNSFRKSLTKIFGDKAKTVDWGN